MPSKRRPAPKSRYIPSLNLSFFCWWIYLLPFLTNTMLTQVSNSSEVFPGTTDRIVLLSGSLNSVLTASRLIVTEIFKEAPKDPAVAAVDPSLAVEVR